jgi:hypothetical protein
MSKDEGSEGFLSRWSKRKAEVREQERVPQPEAPPEQAAVAQPEAEFDPATLPSIDSLTADSDFSVFLKKGVPSALRNAALRKLWVTEPSVVNYQALVEYNWDFTAPGYGELLPTDDVAKIAKHIFSGFSQEPKPEDAPTGEQPVESESQQTLPAPEEIPVADAALAQPDAGPQPEEQPLPRRRHGGALPS